MEYGHKEAVIPVVWLHTPSSMDSADPDAHIAGDIPREILLDSWSSLGDERDGRGITIAVLDTGVGM